MLLRPVVVGALVALASPAAPQEAMTEADFVAPFVADHPSLVANDERLAQAEAALARARALANPRLSVEREQPEGSKQTTVALIWMFPLDGRRGLAIASARAGLRAAERERVVRLARVRLGARAVFSEWMIAAERQRALDAQSRRIAALAERAATRAEAGEESGLVARRIRLTASAVAAELAAGDADVARAKAVARALRPDLPADAAPAPGTPAETPVTGDEVRWLDVLQDDVDQARLEERLAGRFWVAPELQAGWQRQESAAGEASGAVLGASWTVPLFDRGKGARAEAARRRSAAEARLAIATAGYESRRAGAEAALLALGRAAREAAAAIEGVPAVVEAAVASFDAGESTATDLLDVLRSAIDAQTRAIEARAAARGAERVLEAARLGIEIGEPR